MEYCSTCKNILLPEYRFCPVCGAPVLGAGAGGRPQVEEVWLLEKPGPEDAVRYWAWDVFEDHLEGRKPDPAPVPEPAPTPAPKPGPAPAPAPKPGPGPRLHPDTPPRKISSASRGALVYLGGIPWHVLWVNVGSSLLLADIPVHRTRFFTDGGTASWAGSEARRWLNEVFFRGNTFSEEERRWIRPAHILTRTRNEDGQETVERTEDFVTILSTEEYKKYVPHLWKRSKSPWASYAVPGFLRDIATRPSGSHAATLHVENGEERWGSSDFAGQAGIYPAIWWRAAPEAE